MPSGAKKRKAAKKKLQKEAHNTTSNDKDVSNIQGTENAKSHDERQNDGGDEGVNDYEKGTKEVRLGDENVGEYSKEVKSDENFNDLNVDAEHDFRASKNGKHESSSSSSSSSEDDEVPIEKGEVPVEKGEVPAEEEKPVVAEAGEVEQQVSSSYPEVFKDTPVVSEVYHSIEEKTPFEVSRDNPVISEVYHSIEEKIPFEESVKQVVSLPQKVISGSDSVEVDNSTTSHVVESGLKQTLDDEKDICFSSATEFVQEKIETKVIPVADEGSENVSESVDNTARDGEGLPESCDVRSADACCEDNHVNETETHKYVEEQPLISSAPLPVRRTSIMNCCGLFEVLSGGASR